MSAGTAFRSGPLWWERSWIVVAIISLLAGLAAAPAIGALRPERNSVEGLGYRGDAFYVLISSDSYVGQNRWGRSEDGGQTWTAVDRQDLPAAAPWRGRVVAECAEDGLCYRRNDEGYDIESGNDQQGWVVEYRSPTLMDDLAVNPGDSTQAMVLAGRDRIVSRGPDGVWSTVDVIAATSPPAWAAALQGVLHSQLTAIAIGLALGTAGLRRYRSTARTAAVWVGANAVVASWLAVDLHLSGSLPWAFGAWLVLGVAILVIPWPAKARRPAAQDRR